MKFPKKYIRSTTRLEHPALSKIVITKRNRDIREVIDRTTGNILFLVRVKHLPTSNTHLYRWVHNAFESPSWQDRLWMCVIDGIQKIGYNNPLCTKEDVYLNIGYNIVMNKRFRNSISVTETAKEADVSIYLVTKFAEETIDIKRIRW